MSPQAGARCTQALPIEGGIMTIKAAGAAVVAVVSFAFAGSAAAQDLGPRVKKFADGVYALVGENYNSNAGIVLTQDGVVLIDSGHNPIESRKVAEIVKQLTPMPVRLLVDTEPHPDHTTGNFVFPTATLLPPPRAPHSLPPPP